MKKFSCFYQYELFEMHFWASKQYSSCVIRSLKLRQTIGIVSASIPNCYTHAKFERVLPVIYRVIDYFINVVYYF